MKKLSITIISFLCYFVANPVLAKTYFPADTISPALMTQPFDQGSKEEKAEIVKIIAAQKNIDAAVIKQIEIERFLKPEMVIQAVDNSLTRESHPKLFSLLDDVMDTTDKVTDNAKQYWHLRRPFLTDKRVKNLIGISSNAAYPSGHTSESYAIAHIMSLLIPEQRKKFYQRAEEIAQHRVLAGMHFQRDLNGGREIALLVVGGLAQNNEFKKDFAAALKELKK